MLVVLDEAYNEYLELAQHAESAAWVAEHPNLVVSRTFSKAYGLAALRVGYGIMDAKVADMVNRVRQPFNVNALAQAAAVAALADTGYVDESRALNRAGMQQLMEGVRALGLTYVPSHANFLLIRVGDAPRIYQRLLEQGVIVRPVAGYGLPEFLRVTVGLPAEDGPLLKLADVAARAIRTVPSPPAPAPRVSTLAIIGVNSSASFALALKGRVASERSSAPAAGVRISMPHSSAASSTARSRWTRRIREIAAADLARRRRSANCALFGSWAASARTIVTVPAQERHWRGAHLGDAFANYRPSDRRHRKACRCSRRVSTLFRDQRRADASPRHRSAAVATVTGLWSACGAGARRSAVHDRIFAAVSHLLRLCRVRAGRPSCCPSGRRRRVPLCRERISRLHADRRELPRNVARHCARQPRGARRGDRRVPRSHRRRGGDDCRCRRRGARGVVLARGGREARLGRNLRDSACRSCRWAARALAWHSRRWRPPRLPRPSSISRRPRAGSRSCSGSKSISNRTLLLARSRAATDRARPVDADDVERMLDALAALGIDIEHLAETRDFRVRGEGGGIPVKAAKLALGNAGTAFRPLTAVLAFAEGDYELSGVARMHERPIGDLVDALRALGADIDYLGNAGFPPLAIRKHHGEGAIAPDRVTVRGDVSSQFTSALLMALPSVAASRAHAITLDIDGELISKPYVAITTSIMRRFGVAVEQDRWRSFTVPARARYESPGSIRRRDARRPPWRGPWRRSGSWTGVGRHSGASRVRRLAGRRNDRPRRRLDRRRRALLWYRHRLCTIPDAAMTSRLSRCSRTAYDADRIASWRVKDRRIAAMAAELAKLGARVDASDDRMTIVPPERLRPATIATYDDHRIAMCFALAAFGGVTVRIVDPDCVRKTFPGYFASFRAITS